MFRKPSVGSGYATAMLSVTVNQGGTLPGLLGRVYLFKGGLPVKGEGTVQVVLYNDETVSSTGRAVQLEQWTFDNKTLETGQGSLFGTRAGYDTMFDDLGPA